MSHPDPLVHKDVDLSDFRFMPLDVGRLLRSEFWITAVEAAPLVAAVSVNLWAEAWHQKPAASLPDSDVVLARMAMVSKATWETIKPAVLDSWVLCSDGRWYHPTVAEKANEAWVEKSAYRERKAKWAEAGRRGGQKRAENSASNSENEATLQASLEAPSSLASSERDRDSVKGKGKGQGFNDNLSSDPSGPDAPDQAPKESYPADFEAFWKVYPRREGKGAALKAWRAALKLSPVDPIMAAAARYADQHLTSEQRFIKQPATWLNGRCWNDEAPSRPASSGGYVPMGPAGG